MPDLTDECKTYQNPGDMQVINEINIIYLSQIKILFVRLCPYALIFFIFVSDVVASIETNGTINVAVASNFLAPLKHLSPIFEKKTGLKIKIISASTAKLYVQILNGAPYDVFLSADKRTVKRLQTKLNINDDRDLFAYGTGRLVLWSANATFKSVASMQDHFKRVDFARLAMANPKTAPYGRAALQVLQYFRIRMQRNQRILGESVGQAFQFVSTGNVDMGFVAYSQIKGWKVEGLVWLLPSYSYQAIVQYGLLLGKAKPKPASVEFKRFLMSSSTQKILKQKFGYLSIPE